MMDKSTSPKTVERPEKVARARQQWGSQWEFLMSCISTSVGLGNIWRFPFVCYQNGGGAFLFPYVVVLFIIGKPLYFLETSMGQFSSSNGVHIWKMVPAMRGTGYAQFLCSIYIVSYYMSIVSLCLYYFIASFRSPLPWSVCNKEWSGCIPSGKRIVNLTMEEPITSAEYYFKITVLQRLNNIDKGIGAPIVSLALCLSACWLIVFLIIMRGVKSTGKAVYFLSLFPYFVMLILLIRSLTLPGAKKGIWYFITPQWGKIFELEVWYAAVTQCFFSLSVCSGTLLMFSSYNKFTQPIYRDSMIVTTLDTFTSMISGITIFGVLGNLAWQLGLDEVQDVIGTGGSSLAFISYPDAIAQSPFLPQLFAVLFFSMMLVLGIGSGVALISTINTILLDNYPRLSGLCVAACSCAIATIVGLVYTTPGGQFIVELVDFYGGAFLALFAATTEVIGLIWIYGLQNIALDIEYMTSKVISSYWRMCWGIFTPVLLILVCVYSFVTEEKLKFNGYYEYPVAAYVVGAIIKYAGIILVPLFILITFYENKHLSFKEIVKKSFSPTSTYGPREPAVFQNWVTFRTDKDNKQALKRQNWRHHLWLSLNNGYK